MIFQQMDLTDTARRAQRNRIHLYLYLRDDQMTMTSRKQAALAASGRYSRDDDGTMADAESI